MVLAVSPLSSIKSKRRKRKPRKTAPPVAKPWQCIVVAVDPGENSGVAVYDCGKLKWFCEVDVFDQEVLINMLQLEVFDAKERGVPIVIVIEKRFRGEGGASRTLWRRAWEKSGGSKSKIFGFYPATWRSQLFGRGWGSAKQEKARDAEQKYACALSGRPVIGIDEAAAICIGAFACRAAAIGKKLPAKVARLSCP